MIFVFVPYYNEWPGYFQDCLDRQTVKFHLIKYSRKEKRCGWTKACNDFLSMLKTFRGISDEDVICIMNNDIIFNDTLLVEGAKVNKGEILIPFNCQVQIDWRTKQFYYGNRIDTFPGRTFFMKATDFISSGGFSKLLPHYLADYDFGLRMIKRGFRVKLMAQEIHHTPHTVNKNPLMIRSVNNPVFWTIFLLRHGRNKYFFINLIKIWGELFKK